MNKYNVIDTHTGESIIQMSESSLIAQALGMKRRSVPHYCGMKLKWQARYEIILVESTKQPGISDIRTGTKWGNEWDRVRLDPYIWHTIDDKLIREYAPVKPNPYFRGKVRQVAREKIEIEFTPRSSRLKTK